MIDFDLHLPFSQGTLLWQPIFGQIGNKFTDIPHLHTGIAERIGGSQIQWTVNSSDNPSI